MNEPVTTEQFKELEAKTLKIVDDATKQLTMMFARAIADQNFKIENFGRQMLSALATQITQSIPPVVPEEDSGSGGGGGASFSIRYRNDTERATLGLPASDIHRLEWIAQASATDANGNEWANELWQPVAHGEAV